jgi:N-acetylmuramoyl-L-alanine amidase-like protein
LALRGLGILGLTAVTCGYLVGCFQPGRMPSATLPPDIEPAQPRMLSHTPVSPSTSQALIPTPSDSFGLPSLSIDPWKPGVPSRQWTWIVIHHTASSHGSVESIHAAHLQRRDRNGNPWMGIGYHFVIGNGNGMGDGEIEPTFRWREQLQGAHAGDDEHNRSGIGIALVGNFELDPPTPAQMSAVRRLVAVLRTRYGIEKSNVLRHSDIKATACPGKYFPMDELTQRRTEPFLGDRTPAPDLVPVAAQERNRP